MSALDPNELRSMRDLCREFDEYMAQCREAERAKIVRKTHAPPPEPEPEPAPAPAQSAIATALADDVLDGLAGGALLIARNVVEKERASIRAELEKEISRLQGEIDVLTALLRHDEKSKKSGDGAGEIIDLPRVGWHRKA